MSAMLLTQLSTLAFLLGVLLGFGPQWARLSTGVAVGVLAAVLALGAGCVQRQHDLDCTTRSDVTGSTVHTTCDFNR